jgi:non-lysosomal glucosylceramidase
MRKSSFFDNMTKEGGIPLRMMLPLSPERTRLIPADGQMGQIIHAYMDWKLSGDDAWLKNIWPRVKRTAPFAKR